MAQNYHRHCNRVSALPLACMNMTKVDGVYRGDLMVAEYFTHQRRNAGMFSNFLIILSLSLASWTCAATEYHERLTLQPLAPSSLLGSFNFRSNASLTSFEHQDFRFFPRSLGQILQHARTRELHLRFSTGRWDAKSWGARPWNGTKEGGTGVELWAWVEADTDEE